MLSIYKNSIGLIFTLCFTLQAFAQTEEPVIIKLLNPSFESTPSPGRQPSGWWDCGFPGETKADTQPGHFDVNSPAQDGNTYLGMVARITDTWEAVGQRLKTPLKKGQCYSFSLYMKRSDEYNSSISGKINTNGTEKEFPFIKPLKLRIWGGTGYCDKRELLSESSMVSNTHWKEFKFIFKPKQNYKFILFEAFYKTPTPLPYNGNLLVDNCSSIIPVNCDDPTEPLVEIEEPKILADASKPKEKVKNNPKPKEKTKPEPKKVKPVVKPKPKKEKIIAALDKKLKKGQTIKIEKLFFDINQYVLDEPDFPVLDEIYAFLQLNPRVSIEIGGHTNNRCDTKYCNQLSEYRAKSVWTYLVEKGIDKKRLKFKGYGKTKPVASNTSDANRRKNQRVEIKILDV